MNNVFINLGQGLIVEGDGATAVFGLQFFNNTVDTVTQEGVILENTPAAQIANNIFYNVGNGGDNYLSADWRQRIFQRQRTICGWRMAQRPEPTAATLPT